MKTEPITSTEISQQRDSQAKRQCQAAKDLENAGDYEGARTALTGLWSRVGERPSIEKLQTDTQAEVLLRVGALAGWLGSSQQISGAQEFAKDLLSESIRQFESLAELQKTSEAQTDLAICYWREGALDEARILLGHALARSTTPESKLRVLVNRSVVEISANRPDEALSFLNAASSFQASIDDPSLKGRFHQQRGLTYRNLGGAENLDSALIEYSAASHYFALARHSRYQARVENNLGFILMQLGRNFDALLHLDKARQMFVTLKDVGSVAQVNDTRARVLIAQQRYGEAERIALAAATTLEQGGEQSLLAEALITQAIAVARRGKLHPARTILLRAAEIAATAGDGRSALMANLTMIEELHTFLTPANLLGAYRAADEYLGLEPNRENLQRLRHCGRAVIEALGKSSTFDEGLVTGSLEQELLHFEAQLIKRALERANGSITHAARELGITHQGLAQIIDGRQAKTLQNVRSPKRIRRKSIMRSQ